MVSLIGMTGKDAPKRNNFIELERFIACGAVLLFHADLMPLGWIFVEFFFLLTGLFTMQHLQSRKGMEEAKSLWYPLRCTWERIRRLLPYTTAGILLVFIYDAAVWNLKGIGLLRWILYLPSNLLLLNGFGVQAYGFELQDGITAPDLINPHLWYICCMIPALILLVFLLQHTKKSRVLICTILPLVLIGILILLDGTIAGWHRDTLYMFGLDMRALAEMLIGVDVWYAKEWLLKKRFKAPAKLLLTALELFCFFSVFAYAWFSDQPFEILIILMFAVSVALSASGKTLTAHLNFRFFGFLGRLSIPVYCLQMGISDIFSPLFSGLKGQLILGAILVAASLICYFTVEGIRKKIRKKQAVPGV